MILGAKATTIARQKPLYRISKDIKVIKKRIPARTLSSYSKNIKKFVFVVFALLPLVALRYQLSDYQ